MDERSTPESLSAFENWYNRHFSHTPVNTQHINDCEAAWNAALYAVRFARERHADEYFALGVKSTVEPLDPLLAHGAAMAAAAAKAKK